MKAKVPPLIVLMFLLVLPSYATHYMGGEISWECLPNGNFRFVMKVYRECYTNAGGMAATYMNPETITGPFGNITMYLYPNATLGKRDISPVCHPDGSLHYACELGSTSGMTANLGAVQEWTYTSDSAYPNGVMLNGIPPPTGWVFYWDGCCRNSAFNYNGQPNWYIKAKMYPYNGHNAYPCFDNSPRFHSPPLTSIPLGYPFAFNLNVQDPDLDSLAYSLTPALSGVLASVPYNPGYSASSPFPGPVFNPQNVSAALDPVTGEFSFTSFTQGAYITAVKTSSYRCGVLIAEVTREIQVSLLPNVIIDFPQTNTVQNFPPEISFQAQGSGPSVTLDTVWAGEYLEYDISVVDTLPPLFLAPLGTPNGMTFQAAGQDFGDGYSSDSSGCPYPPCATLSPTPDTINSNPNFLVLNAAFRWQTDCGHITGPCGSNDYVHVFSFTAADVACPVPARNTHTYSVMVKDPVLDPPLLHTLDVWGTGITVKWSPPDTTKVPNTFNGYFIYHALFNNGPFLLIDSLSAYTDTVYTFTTPILYPGQYVGCYVRTRSGCDGMTLSLPSNILDDFLNSSDGNEAVALHSPVLYQDPTTAGLRFRVNTPGTYSLEIRNLQGQCVWSCPSSYYATGDHLLDWSAGAQARGIYIATAISPGNAVHSKVLLR